ncbi:hypothetical protein [Escherichia coli]|nr:hypothetical protein [Escherichia coli]WGT25160.1 hypothetical protein QC817_22945 [Escherichia coli]
MTIYENPVKFRFKRLKSDSTNFNGTDFGWIDQITNSDSTYFYTEVTVSYPETYVYYERFTKAGLNNNINYSTLKFTLGSGVPEAPRYLSGQFHFKKAIPGHRPTLSGSLDRIALIWAVLTLNHARMCKPPLS